MADSETVESKNRSGSAKKNANSGGSTHARSKMPRRRKIFFALIPLAALFVLVEATLWLVGYESPVADPYDSFVLRRPLFVESAGKLTTAFPRQRFFHRQSFATSKPPGTKRVFVFGGSTTYGYALPDPWQDSYVLRLGNLLQKRFPGTIFEMINCGGQSYASYRLVDLVEECMDYSPDLVIIMTGHNEFIEKRFYSELSGFNSATKRAWYSLKTVRLVAHLSNKFHAKKYDGLNDKAFIGENPFVTEQYIVRDEREIQHTFDHYTRNLNRMVDACQKNNTPVILCTCPSNLLDHRPFESEPPSGMSREEFFKNVGRAFQLLVDEKFEESMAAVQPVLKIDPRNAFANFIAGRCQNALGRFEEAKQSLILAKDADSFPKRTLTSFNQRVREIAKQRGTPLFDAENLFFEKAENGIPGKSLFIDDCHPTVAGHGLFADGLVDISAKVFATTKK